MKSSFTIPTAIVMGGIIVAVAVYVSQPKRPDADAGNPALVRPVSASDHILGNPAAPVVIVEYSDFDCDFCKGFHDTLHQIIANAGANGKVAWVFRHFPLSEIHPNARAHARAAECVAATSGNDAFWKFSNALFASQPVDPSNYGALASSVGISGDTFATCYSTASTTLDARITADRQNALDIGAAGTPYSIMLVNGSAGWRTYEVMAGAYSYDAVKQLIDQALAQ
ncbi:thioredoxin domain-containing protein [Candidatus Kaiserbacteria bacterium]|nr:thioredoxin domain-containing protein [Candidatus Kaiserbacteria bacterium]